MVSCTPIDINLISSGKHRSPNGIWRDFANE